METHIFIGVQTGVTTLEYCLALTNNGEYLHILEFNTSTMKLIKLKLQGMNSLQVLVSNLCVRVCFKMCPPSYMSLRLQKS